MKRRARVAQLLAARLARLCSSTSRQLLEPAARAWRAPAAAARGSPPGSPATSPTRSRSGSRFAVSAFGGDVEPDDLRLLAEAAAEAEPEVHRHADHQRHVGALQRGRAGAAESELVIGGQAAAAEAVEEDWDPERLGERPQLPLAVRTSRGRCRP